MPPIRLMKPYIRFADVEVEFRDIFDSGIFTRGTYVESFRREIVAYTGSQYAYLTTSATTALWICLKLLGIGPGDEVAVSDFSFPATANVVEDLGARPIFIDVDLETFNMLPHALEAAITTNTKAVIFVDALGNPSGLAEIKAICENHGLPLVEDAACAMGSAENSQRCGSIADLTCFSFHPRKLISTGEGGAITTNREDWASWLEVKLGHGAKGMRGAALDFVDFGYNFRLSELQAIMGSKQLKKIEEIIDERNSIRNAYIDALMPMGFTPQKLAQNVRHNVQSMVFKVQNEHSRDNLIYKLREMNMETTIGTYSLSASSYYSKKYATPQANSKNLENTTITFPCFSGVNVQDAVDRIKKALL